MYIRRRKIGFLNANDMFTGKVRVQRTLNPYVSMSGTVLHDENTYNPPPLHLQIQNKKIYISQVNSTWVVLRKMWHFKCMKF